MNLKESFRYQTFLEAMMRWASASISESGHCLTVTKIHKRKNANPDAEDITETIECDGVYYPNDDVIKFMEFLISQREQLTEAISKAKASIGFDVDAAIETNKFRQILHSSIKRMMSFSPYRRIEPGRDYKFNVEGNQTPYIYDIEVVSTEAYNKDRAKEVMRDTISKADETSAEIDAAFINTQVDYVPFLDVNDSFEDAMEEFTRIVL